MPGDLIAPEVVTISLNEGSSPNDLYRLTVSGTSPNYTLRITATGSASTLVQIPFSGMDSEAWGFSPDDDRFVFHRVLSPGVRTVSLYDLTAASPGSPVYQGDLDEVSNSILFAPDGGQLVLQSTGGAHGNVFRLIDPTTGDVVFQPGGTDFDHTTQPWGFSPDGSLLIYHYLATGRHYVRGYDLTPPLATRKIAYDNPDGSAELRFSSNGAYLLDAYTNGPNSTALQVRSTASGALVYSDTFTFASGIGFPGDKFKGAGWGFSPRAGNLLYAIDKGGNALQLNLVNLATGTKVRQVDAPNVVSGFWRFSSCGDVLVTVLQGASGLVVTLYATGDGSVLYSGGSSAIVGWYFQATALEQQASNDSIPWYKMTDNTAGQSCTPPVPDTTPPAWDGAAILTAVESATHGEVDLAWAPAATDAGSGVLLYAIYQDGSEIATVPAGTLSYTVGGLASNSTHTFKVEAEDGAPAHNRTTNGPAKAITLSDWEPPAWAPGDALSAANATTDSLDLVWPAASDTAGVTQYRIYRSGGLYATPAGGMTTLAVSGLAWGSDYHFEIEALDAAGNVSSRLTLDTTTAGAPPGAQPPAWPGGAVLSVTVTGPETIDLSWPAAGGPDGVGGYDVRLDGHRIAQLGGGQSTFSVTGLLPDTDWSFEVVARNVWLQAGPPLVGAGHTDPGTHVDPPIPAPLVSPDVWSDSGFSRVSRDGRYVSYHTTEVSGGPDFLYDRITTQVVGIASSLLSGDGRHVVQHQVNFDPVDPNHYQAQTWVVDLDTSSEALAYEVDSANGGSTDVRELDVSEDGSRVLVEVLSALDPTYWWLIRTDLLVVEVGTGVVAYVASVGSVCPDTADSCDLLDGAWLAPDGSGVVYWGRSKATSASDFSPWVRSYAVAGGGTHTRLTLGAKHAVHVGPGSAAAAGFVAFATDDALLPADLPRTPEPFDPTYSRDELDVYTYDMATGEIELLSVDAGGTSVGGLSPSVSDDGRFVAYEGGRCGSGVGAVYDRWLKSTRCVSTGGSSTLWNPVLAAGGRYLIFESDAVAEQGIHLADLAWKAPSWPVPASIVMTGNDFTTIDFTWTPAEDHAQFPAALGDYVIYRDGAPDASLPFVDFLGRLPSHQSTGLRPATDYDYAVQLRDAAGGETTNGPQALLRTRTPTADVSLTIVDSPDPVGTSRQVRYDITLANAGPDPAFDGAFDFTWPAGFGFVAANPMAGSCDRPAPGRLACQVGDVPAGGSVQVVVVLSTGASGVVTVSGSATAIGDDPVPSNGTDVQESTDVVVGGSAQSAGPVVGWGDDSAGQTSPPEVVARRTAAAVAGGLYHSCAIQAETGAVVCWGDDSFGQATPPTRVDGTQGSARVLAAGEYFNCAIRSSDHGVVCWGRSDSGQTSPPTLVDGNPSGALAIAAGSSHACAIREDTRGVVCWGSNTWGKRSPPSTVNGTSGTASAIAVGRDHSCAIQAETDAVVCWGSGTYGQTAVPDEVDGTSGTASALAAGSDGSCAIQSGTGRVVCWGAPWLGITTPPASVGGGGGSAVAVAVGATACAIQAGIGGVVCWGSGAEAPPSQVDGRAGRAGAIAAGGGHFCAIQEGTRAAVCWGGPNFSGERTVPGGLTGVSGSGGVATAVAAGAQHGCAIDAGSEAVLCWGSNSAGQTTVPAGVDGTGGTGVAVAAGVEHSCAIQSGSGAVLCWGSNAAGETVVPAEVDGTLGTARSVAAGGAYSCAIQDGTDAVVCWGDGSAGQTSVPAAVDGSAGTASALAAGTAHACAVQAETGGVVCWGDGSAGQTSVPAAVDGSAGTAIAVAAGDAHSCAIQEQTGAVVCWGDDGLGQSTPPPGVDGSAGGARAISAGGDTSCAVQDGSGAVLCWGDGALGQRTPPVSLDGEAGGALDLATGAAHGLALYVPEPDALPLAIAVVAALLGLRARRRRSPAPGGPAEAPAASARPGGVFADSPLRSLLIATLAAKPEGVRMVLRSASLLALLAVIGCSGLKRPDLFLLSENQATWEEGERLVAEGEQKIAAGEQKIAEGRELRERADRMIDEGREERKGGEALAQRGRQALRAAQMLEEAEKLRREGGELREKALPTP